MNRLQSDIVLTAIIALSVSACSSLSDKSTDAQSVSSVGPTPRELPPSRYGNPERYEVFGEEYHVATTSYGYHQVGTASWYGPKFHGKRTSSGKTYDMHLMTAAHKTLPIPTFVQVTRLDTGRSIIVEVNDRGPFVDDRVIDLSHAAAQQLDMLGPGTAPVEVKALPPYQYLARHQGSRQSAPFMLAQNQQPPATTTPKVATPKMAAIPQNTSTSAAAYPTRRNLESASTNPVPAIIDPVTQSPAATSVVAAPATNTLSTPEPLLLMPNDNLASTEYIVSSRAQDNATLPALEAPNVYLQAGAFAQKTSAERLYALLSQSLVWGVEVNSAADAMYRVRIGPLRDSQDIDDARIALAQLGIQNSYLIMPTEMNN